MDSDSRSGSVLWIMPNTAYSIALMVAAYVRGNDERTRMLRRNIVRYCVLSQALVFRDISMRVRKRFPEMDNLVASGFMMQHEKDRFDEIQYRYAKYWMPFQWALGLCQEARSQQKIASDILLQKVGEEIKLFRTNMAILCNFDWVPLPIMYPQLIVLAVHTYFLVCVLSRQFVISDGAANKSHLDIIFPFMTMLQFIFYMGWLKVAEAMLNPFGEDDDDFECNFLLDKNLTIGLTVVDEGYNKTPIIKKDIFWNKKIEPLYTMQSVSEEQPMSGITGSLANVKFNDKRNQPQMLPLPHEYDEDHPAHNFGLFRRSFQRRFGGSRSLSHGEVPYTDSTPIESAMKRNGTSERDLNSIDRVEKERERNRKYRRSSLTSAIEAIVNDPSGGYTNFGVTVGDESPSHTKDGQFVFPSHRDYHGFRISESLTPNGTSHRLEDLMEENEENGSRHNTVIKPEDNHRIDVVTIANLFLEHSDDDAIKDATNIPNSANEPARDPEIPEEGPTKSKNDDSRLI